MRMLTKERFDAARRFVLDGARGIDRALFLHLFEGADPGEQTVRTLCEAGKLPL
jgi:hypothetical protein